MSAESKTDALDRWSDLLDYLKYDAAESVELQGLLTALDPVIRALLAAPSPVSKPEPFVVRHYTSDERPSIKGNGFDGLQVGEDREDAEQFVAWLNERLAAPPAEPVAQSEPKRCSCGGPAYGAACRGDQRPDCLAFYAEPTVAQSEEAVNLAQAVVACYEGMDEREPQTNCERERLQLARALLAQGESHDR